MASFARKFLLFLGGFLILALSIVLIAPQFLPTDVYKQKVVAAFEDATGRTLAIDGSIGLRFIPRVQLTLNDVHLKNPDNFGAKANEHTASLSELQLSLSFLSLLQGEIDIRTLRLKNPHIHLMRNAKGEPNWVIETRNKPENPRPSADQPAQESSGLERIRLPHMEIINGNFSYQPSPDEPAFRIDQFNASIRMPDAHKPMSVTIETRVNDTLPTTLELELTTLAGLLEGQEATYDATLAMDGNALQLRSEGRLQHRDSPRLNGSLHLTSTPKKLGKGLRVATPANLETLKLDSTLGFANDRLQLDDTTLVVNDVRFTGKATANLAGTRPAVTLSLASDNVLELDAFLPPPADEKSTPANTSSPADPSATGGWSQEPLLADTAILKTADADITLAMAGLVVDKLRFGAFTSRLKLQNGVLDFTLPQFAFYEGKGTFSVHLSPQGANALQLRSDAKLEQADIGQFLRDATDNDRLSGKGALNLHVTTHGTSLHDWMNQLNGNGAIALTNGAIHGFNLAEIIENIRQTLQSLRDGGLTAEAKANAKTDFSSLDASFTIRNGVLNNPDLSLKAPLINVTGSGDVNIGAQTLDYRLRPSLVGSLQGESRTQDARGITVPVRVSGSFDRLRFLPDAGALVEEAITDPKATFKGLEDNVRNLRDDMKSLLRGNK